MIHPDLERANRILDREKAEREVIEELVEQFLQNPDVAGYVNDTLDTYNLDFDRLGAMTETNIELICQYQNLIHVQIVAGMLRRLTGRQ